MSIEASVVFVQPYLPPLQELALGFFLVLTDLFKGEVSISVLLAARGRKGHRQVRDWFS